MRVVADDGMAEPGGHVVVSALGTYYESKSADCGCPEASFAIVGTDLSCLVHFEADGLGEVYVENEGGRSWEWEVEAKTLAELVGFAVDKVHTMEPKP